MLGLVGSAAVAVGASQPASPYAYKGLPAGWFFGVPAAGLSPAQPAPAGAAAFAGVLAVLFGMALLALAWLWLVRWRLRGGAIGWRGVSAVMLAWSLPLLLTAPVLSRDVYTYAAQGQMVSLGVSPYLHGPAVLGATSPFDRLTDPIWRPSVSPYGPAFLWLDGRLVAWSGHQVLASVVALRLVALVGVVAAAAGAALVARRLGTDPVVTVLLVACSPLVLLDLVGGAHNDAPMVGLLALAVAAAMSRRLVLATFVCALAAAVKLPAALGLVFIGWTAPGSPATPLWRRAATAAVALAAGAGVLEVLAVTTGLGWGFTRGLSNAGVVHLWLDPSTGIGMAIGKLLGLFDLSGQAAAVSFARAAGLLVAAAAVLVLLRRSGATGLVPALGWALLVAAVLDSAIEPWYLSWGLVLLSAVDRRSARAVVLAGSALCCFLGVPIGSVIVHQLEASRPAVAAGGAVATALAVALLAWSGWSRLLRPGLAAQEVTQAAYRGGGERVV